MHVQPANKAEQVRASLRSPLFYHRLHKWAGDHIGLLRNPSFTAWVLSNTLQSKSSDLTHYSPSGRSIWSPYFPLPSTPARAWHCMTTYCWNRPPHITHSNSPPLPNSHEYMGNNNVTLSGCLIRPFSLAHACCYAGHPCAMCSIMHCRPVAGLQKCTPHCWQEMFVRSCTNHKAAVSLTSWVSFIQFACSCGLLMHECNTLLCGTLCHIT
jgi:hypothetical protein